MATIRKRGQRYQVQVRRRGHSLLSRSFRYLEDAKLWARQIEAEAGRSTLPNRKALNGITLGQLVGRYRNTIVPRKRGAKIETIILNAFLLDYSKLCEKALADLSPRDFASYRERGCNPSSPAR